MKDIIDHLEKEYSEFKLATYDLKKLERVKEELHKKFLLGKAKETQSMGINIAHLDVKVYGGTTQIADRIHNEYATGSIIKTEIEKRLQFINNNINRLLDAEIKELLHNFNFDEQKSAFDEHWESITNCGAFVIHGNQNTGQDLLLNYFIQSNRLFDIEKITIKPFKLGGIFRFEHLMDSLLKDLTGRKNITYNNLQHLCEKVINKIVEKAAWSNLVIELKGWLPFLTKEYQGNSGVVQFYEIFWNKLLDKCRELSLKKILFCFIENEPIENNRRNLPEIKERFYKEILLLPCIEEVCENYIHNWVTYQVKSSKYKPYFKPLYIQIFKNKKHCKMVMEEYKLRTHKMFHEFIYDLFKSQCIIKH